MSEKNNHCVLALFVFFVICYTDIKTRNLGYQY